VIQTTEADNRQTKESGLEAAIQNSDELLDITLNLEAGEKKPKFCDEVQFTIEKSLFDYCQKEGFMTYGFVLDAFYYCADHKFSETPDFARYAEMKKLKPANVEYIKKHVLNISKVIEKALEEAKSTFNLDDKELEGITGVIRERYSNFGNYAYRSKGFAAPVNRRYDHTYEVLWSPWFKKLNAEFISVISPLQKKGDEHLLLKIKYDKIGAIEDDFLLEAVVKAEERDRHMNEITGHIKHPKHYAVQLRIENNVFDFCLKSGFQPYGALIDALSYILNGNNLENGYFNSEAASKRFDGKKPEQIKEHVIEIAKAVEQAYLRAVDEYALKGDSGKEILGGILGSYSRFCTYGDRGAWGKRSKEMLADAKHPYDVLWEPWFNKLNAKFQEARRFFERERKTNSVI
jgi:hypothetical protein